VTAVEVEDVNQRVAPRFEEQQTLAAFHRFVLNTLAHLHSVARSATPTLQETLHQQQLK
jgi:hypothetical protein